MNAATGCVSFTDVRPPKRPPGESLKTLRAFVPILAAVLPHFCNAAGILDQSFTGPNSAAFIINEGASSVAQTFTTGLSGTLAGVNLDIYSYYTPGNFPLHITLCGVSSGIPNNSFLGETTIGASGVGLDQLITFPQPISLTTGVQYAIVVDYAGALPQNHAQGAWQGGGGDSYLGGMQFGLYSGTWMASPSIDGHFRTFVEPVPEPSGPCLMLPLGIALFLRAQASRRAH